ncbi:GDSL-like Lipase/Acylhydrolase [Deinococcus peraridilitoris DSM 19664]|uniref:GDSL-like Lipase/Acylhydrolase n=2 Tax=Deinococcus TaxID=1298 RepID=L0A083_DEIPD|nr:GDSL-like Lipase/Acylhydrolase [Deinococcus peraridilitoris DSM 19664]
MAAVAAARYLRTPKERTDMFTVYTFGDSILDCGRYNPYNIHPAQLIVHNNDTHFPEFKGQDLSSRFPATYEHRAVDGATVDDLPSQTRGLTVDGPAVALLTIGGNDLIRGLSADTGPAVEAFEQKLDRFLQSLPIRPVLLGTVYDPTFGDDRQNFLSTPAGIARRNHKRVNTVITQLGERYGGTVDLHAHFLSGDPSWFTSVIEPSLTGASEVRRAFLHAILASGS